MRGQTSFDGRIEVTQSPSVVMILQRKREPVGRYQLTFESGGQLWS